MDVITTDRRTIRMKRIGNWLSNILLIVVIIFAISFVYNTIQLRQNPGQLPSTFGFIPLTVLSGSMSPTIETGDMIVVKVDKDNLIVGDIITYKMGSNLVTHRIIEATTENGVEAFVTQGDANNVEDGTLVTKEQIVGKYAFRIPYAGYIKAGLRGWLGILLITVMVMLYLITIIFKETKIQLNKPNVKHQ
jgi:signal peptidase